MSAAVNMRSKQSAFFRDFPHMSKTEHLKTSAIRQNRFVPVHELMQTTGFPDNIASRPQHKVISIRQNDLSSCPLYIFRFHSLDSCLGPYRHEYRSLYDSVRCCNTPAPCACLLIYM